MFGCFRRKPRELNATGRSPCCLPGSGAGGGARVSYHFTQGPKSSAIFRSCSASGYGAWAAVFSRPSPVGVCWEPPFCTSAMQAALAQLDRPCNQACNTIQGLGLRVWGLRALKILGLGCSRCRNMLEPLPAFFGVCRVPRGGGLYTPYGSFLQEAESTVTFENCTSGASVASGSPLGNDVWGG